MLQKPVEDPKPDDPKTKEADAPEVPAVTEEQSEEAKAVEKAVQAKVDKIAAKIRQEAREEALKTAKAEADADQAKAKKLADDAALKEQAKFQELAENREVEIRELQTASTTLRGELDETKVNLERAEKALTTYLETIESELTIPDGVRELLEGKGVAERLEWLTKNRDSFKAGDTPEVKPPVNKGLPPVPDPKRPAAVTDDEKKKLAVSPRMY